MFPGSVDRPVESRPESHTHGNTSHQWAGAGLSQHDDLVSSPNLCPTQPYFPSIFFAAATRVSGSNPYFRCNAASGAEAPKVFIPMMWPRTPV